MNATVVYRNMVDTNKYCGTVTPLAMVVDRFAAIENFKPHPIGSYRYYILLVMKKAVFKRKTENS
jgi:hypothetical protein